MRKLWCTEKQWDIECITLNIWPVINDCMNVERVCLNFSERGNKETSKLASHMNFEEMEENTGI